MAYEVMIRNEEGEPLGMETHYDDEPGYWDDQYDFDADYGPATEQYGLPYEWDE